MTRAARGLFLTVLWFPLAALSQPPPSDLSCQVETKDGTPLQTLLKIECNVSGDEDTNSSNSSHQQPSCNCTSLFLSADWYWITAEMNNTLFDHIAEPGQWLAIDPSTHCIASTHGLPILLPQSCPPGFYCAGGLSPPRSCSSGDHCFGGQAEENRRCPFGYYCPFPAAEKVICPDGGLCYKGSIQPRPCDAGTYCKSGDSKPCTQGNYCPVGVDDPVPCNSIALCPEGSGSQDIRIATFAGLVVCALFTFLGARFYKHIVRCSIWPMIVCLGLIAVFGTIEPVIAGFLSLFFYAVCGNWILLHIPWLSPKWTVILGRVLSVSTMLATLVALWMLNHPWAIMIGGLFFVAIIWWFMSREHKLLVFVGRVLLLFSFCVLMYAYVHVDPAFASTVGLLLVLMATISLLSWAIETYRQRRRVRLDFVTRWMNETSEALGASRPSIGSSGFSGGAQQASGTVDSAHPLPDLPRPVSVMSPTSGFTGSPPMSPSSWTSSLASFVTSGVWNQQDTPLQVEPESKPVSGVSFRLKDVNFDLPDGVQLLHDVSLSIAPGKRVAVMGASGSGKSTLLAVLSGRASYGRVGGELFVGGRPSDDLRFLRHVTGFVPQDDILHGELTTEQNVWYQAALRLPVGTSIPDIEMHVERTMTDLNLMAIRQSRVGTAEKRGISGGQRKRVSIAMELVSQPLLLFADEPTSGLDSTTSYEVIKCLNTAAARLGATVIAVIHQPRYETLNLFDDLVLLSEGGLAYSGATEDAVDHFTRNLQVEFPANTNPADIFIDALQSPHEAATICVEAWTRRVSLQEHDAECLRIASKSLFHRERPPFITSVLTYMDRSMHQMMCAHVYVLIAQTLTITATTILCSVLKYTQLNQFMMQCALACLLLMLLQGVSAQRIFGEDLLITWREARVGMPMVAYFLAKDFAALFEVTISSVVFTAAYGSFSGMQLEVQTLFGGSWAFIYAVYGLNYMLSIILSQSGAQMAAVVSAFVAFCVAGVYQPQLPEITTYFDDRGWMVAGLSPIRWLWGYLLTHEARYLTPVTRGMMAANLKWKGYDLAYIYCPIPNDSIVTFKDAWKSNQCWVCSVAPMLLLGVLFRFLACLCLILHVNARTTGWARFLAQSEVGVWKLLGKLFTMLAGTFLALFLFSEDWVFGIVSIQREFFTDPHVLNEVHVSNATTTVVLDYNTLFT